MRWASALSDAPRYDAALESIATAVSTSLGGAPDLAFLFVSADHAMNFGRIAEVARARLGARVLVGTSGGGIAGDGREIERSSAVSVLAGRLPGVDVHPFRLAVGEVPPEAAAWHARVGVDPLTAPSFVVLADPFTCPIDALLDSLDAAWPHSRIVGGLASGGRQPGQHALFADGVSHAGGAVGVALVGDVEIAPVVAQGCRPIGPTFRVTQATRNVLVELDGATAVTRLDATYEGLSPNERALFRQAPLVGVAQGPEGRPIRHGDFLVRNVLGLDRDAGVVAVGWRPTVGERVQFHLRDAQASAFDLDEMLTAATRAGGPRPAAALLFSCLGRGEGLYGTPGHDSAALVRHLGEIPIGGFFCSGEIGPVHGRTQLHGYTSSIGLLRSRGWE